LWQVIHRTTHQTFLSQLTDLTREGAPFHVAPPREGSNDADDYLDSTIYFIATSALVEGDVLVVDNATVHGAASIGHRLDVLLEEAGVRLLFLPKYSPELNPCELVFSQMKRHMYCNRGDEQFWVEMAKGLATVTRENVEGYYRKCILHPLRER